MLNGTETRISFDSIQDLPNPPAVSGNYVAWVQLFEDLPPGLSSKFVYIYNTLTGDEYAVSPSEGSWQTAPFLSGDIIVWLEDPDGFNFKVVAYDAGTRTWLDEVTSVPGDYYNDPSQNAFPKVSGDEIVWQDFSQWEWDVYSYTIGSGTGTPVPLVADAGYDEKNPAIYGDYVVYENWSSIITSDIYLFFRSNGTAIQISDSPDNDLSPSVYGNMIVWEGASAITGLRVINRYNLLTGETSQITPTGAAYDQMNPEIYGNFVVVEDYREDPAYPDIYLYDLSTGEEQWLTPGSNGLKRNPMADGDRIVWEDHRADYACGGCQEYDIYLLTRGTAEVCPAADFSIANPYGPAALTPTFTDTSSAGTSGTTFRVWNFSDGSPWSFNPGLSVSHSFTADGIYPASLYVGNTKCRNLSVDTCSHRVYVNQPPVAGFTPAPEYGFAPLNVAFIDTSCGGPTSWTWDFGDSTAPGTTQNPLHTFTDPATSYLVTLTATNDQGSNSTWKRVRTFMGGQSTASTPVNGIHVVDRFGGPFLVFNATELPSFEPPAPEAFISIRTPQDNYWENITFLSTDGTGLKKSASNSTYFGNISRVYLKTNDTVVNAVGTPPSTGSGWGVNYRLNTTTYPDPGSLKTEIWEGAISADQDTFDTLARNSQPAGTTLRDIAYTAKFTRTGITNEGSGLLNMSVAQGWVQGSAPSLDEGRTYTYILGYGYDGQGNKNGAILDTRYRFSSSGRDYFEAVVPDTMHYLSTFALAKLSGSGNPLQLITLTVSSHTSSPSSSVASYSSSGITSDSDSSAASGTGSGGVKATSELSPQEPAPENADPGVTGTVYTNANGVVTQASSLVSLDNLASLSLPEGVVAKDAAGNPLSSVTLRASSPGITRSGTPGSAFTFEGMAYELGPDGAAFSPSISLTFTVPQVSWGKDYAVRSFDQKTSTWQDLPTTFDPATGTVTAEISHFCCFGLFAKTAAEPEVSLPIPAQTGSPDVSVPPAPPATAVSIFTSMMAWAGNLLVSNLPAAIVIVLAVLGTFIFYKRKWG